MNRYVFRLMIFFACLSPWLRGHSASIEVDPNQSELLLTPNIEWLVDSNNNLTIEDIREANNPLPFKKTNKDALSWGSSDHSYWIRFSLSPVEQAPTNANVVERYLELGFAAIKKVDVYVFQETQLISHQYTGTYYPFSHRVIKHPHFIFPVSMTPGETVDVYIQIRNEGPVSIPIRLWTPQAFMDNATSWYIAYGIFFGIMFGLAAYNLFLMLSTRDRSYLYYTCHILGVIGLALGFTGLGSEFVWGEHPVFTLSSTLFAACFTHFFAVEFTRSFLQTGQHAPSLDRALQLIRWLFVFSVPLLFIAPKTVMINIVSISILLSVALIISAGVLCYMKNLKMARLFLVAWGIYELSTIAKISSILGLLPDNFYTFNATMFGSAIETVLLSFALADRINQMKSEKQQLQKNALAESEKSNQIKNEFLSTISHELRTPMNGVEGALELLETQQLDKKSRDCVYAALASAENMTRLIDEILTFSEIQSDKITIKNEIFSLRALIERLEQDLQHTLQIEHINYCVESEIDFETYWIGDFESISKILSHFLDNAIKFSKKGKVSILVKRTQHNGHSLVEFKVTDFGIGIAREQLERIFEAFQQLDSSFSRSYAGLGIGLAICHHLAKKMQGHIHVESELGKGSTFSLLLPLTEERAEMPAIQTPTKRTQDNGKLTILVVEDNPVNQLVIVGMLEKLGYHSISAFNGLEAIKKLEQHPVDICLMDCQMPVMDGFEATQSIRDLHTSQAHMPIIAVTANAMSADKERCLQAGMSDYIKKPVSLNNLRSTLEKWLPQVDAEHNQRTAI